MNTEVSQFIQAYKDAALNRSLSSAVLQPSPAKNTVSIRSSWSISDLVKSESTKFVQEYMLEWETEKFKSLSQGMPWDVSSMSRCAFTKSGKRYAALQKSKKNDDSLYLEIWNSCQKEFTFDMSERKEHGKIYDSGEMQSFQWSSNEKFILYIAEQKQKKTESYFKDTFVQKSEQKPNEEIVKGEENLFKEVWGETYPNVHHTVLCILEVETGRVEVVNMDEVYPNVSVAQASWGPKDECIIFVGYEESPFRLGLVYCSNRRSSIYSYNLTTKAIEKLVNEENACVECPVFSPNFETFVYLQNQANGPHKSCRKLMKFQWKEKKVSTVLDIVEDVTGDEFAGIYISSLMPNWWSQDSQHFFFHTFRRSFLEIFCVDIISSKLQKIDVDKSYGSCRLLDVQDPYILISVSAPNITPMLMIGYFSNLDSNNNIIWSPVSSNSHKMQDIEWNIETIKPSLINKTYSNLDYEILTISSSLKNNGTLIIFPHGGPHSVFNAGYYEIAAAFARLGYIICMVNYRGSIGFGENSIKSLLGNVGSQDVSDTVNAVEYLKKNSKHEIKNVIGFGGSHGGFIIAHLVGQFPDLLKAACIRNPVIDLTLFGISDIPDWGWIESGCLKTYDPLENLNPSYLKEMWEKSPIRYVKNVKSPTMLCLGKKDLRVPSSQGFQFYKYLKAQGVPTKVYNYDDNHSLSKVATASDAFVNIASWFQTHLSV